jgi:adenylate kinase
MTSTWRAEPARERRLLLIGAPGAGKGTQATRIAEHFSLTHISSGDLLRRHMADGTEIGQVARQYVERGDLVPDRIVIDMLIDPLVAASATGGYVLDGFPRTVEQARSAYKLTGALGVAVQVAVHLDVPTEDLVRRLLARRRGAEDTPEVIAHRIEVYQQHTVPLLDYYADREKLIVVNGARPIGEVSWSLLVQLERTLTR